MSRHKSELSFDNTEIAFALKKTKQLNRSRVIFGLFKNKTLVRIFSKLTLVLLKLKFPINSLIKKTVFKEFCAGETLDESKKVVEELQLAGIGSILDYSVEGKESVEDLERTKNEIIRIIQLAEGNPSIPYTSLKVSGIVPVKLLERMSNERPMSFLETKVWLERVNEICCAAAKFKVPVYFDAEESWIQDAIDELAEQMMRKYNKNQAIVLTTLQLYRWDRIEYLNKLICAAREESFYVGIKLVRGAYYERENKRAIEMKYKSPVHVNKELTDRDFDKAITTCLENIDIITLCAGTHNEDSSLFLVDEMKRLDLPHNHPKIYFSQLYGMSDHISYNLAAKGYNVTKYLPYGPIKSVIPYLIRRAEENTAISGQMGRELNNLVTEINRRKEVKLLQE